MTDPTFQTRAELEAWAKDRAAQMRACVTIGMHSEAKDVLAKIRRVTLAHMHLPFEEPKP